MASPEGTPLFSTMACIDMALRRIAKVFSNLFSTVTVIGAFQELNCFSHVQGAIHFHKDKPLSSAFVKKLVKARV
ncbi:MAG TPA: hypothetical protein VN843_13045 [Anaerolineales bacterium]|nr:hypothetical protein [Anaerolineales bacterium]